MRNLFRPTRWPTAIAAVAVVASTIAAGPAGSAGPDRTELASVPLMGTTTVSAPAGVHGIVFTLPADASWYPREDTIVHPFDGEYAAVLGTSDQYDRDTDCIDRFCPTVGFDVLPDFAADNVDGTIPDATYNNGFVSGYGCTIDGQDRCPLRVTELELYIATDAPLTFTMHIPELTGTASYQVTGQVDGELLELPDQECPGGDCERWSYGGAVRTAGTDERPGMVGGIAYARTSYAQVSGGTPASVIGTYSVNGCSYPSFFVPSGSADAAEHPLGCDFTPTISDTPGIQWDNRWVDVMRTGLTTGRADGLFFGSGDVNGEAYAGFHARNHHTVPGFEGAHGAYAYWITQGIYAD
jgi:hypothetical protein